MAQLSRVRPLRARGCRRLAVKARLVRFFERKSLSAGAGPVCAVPGLCNTAARCASRCSRRAAELVAAASQEQNTLPRLLTSARLAWELGRRASAVQLLENADRRVQTEDASVHDEPFLAPSVRYEHLFTGAPTDEWVRCAIVEQWERLGECTRRTLPAPRRCLCSKPLPEWRIGLPEMERRRQLIRMRAGMQSEREAQPPRLPAVGGTSESGAVVQRRPKLGSSQIDA